MMHSFTETTPPAGCRVIFPRKMGGRIGRKRKRKKKDELAKAPPKELFSSSVEQLRIHVPAIVASVTTPQSKRLKGSSAICTPSPTKKGGLQQARKALEDTLHVAFCKVNKKTICKHFADLLLENIKLKRRIDSINTMSLTIVKLTLVSK